MPTSELMISSYIARTLVESGQANLVAYFTGKDEEIVFSHQRRLLCYRKASRIGLGHHSGFFDAGNHSEFYLVTRGSFYDDGRHRGHIDQKPIRHIVLHNFSWSYRVVPDTDIVYGHYLISPRIFMSNAYNIFSWRNLHVKVEEI